MTLVQPIFRSTAKTVSDAAQPQIREHKLERDYKRILVFSDGRPEAEQALRKATELARATDAVVILVCRQHTGADDYMARCCENLRRMGVEAYGYSVARNITQLPAWLVESEKADAVVIAQETVGRWQRWLGGDVAATLRAKTNAAVFTVAA